MGLFLAIDGGGSHTRCLAIDADGIIRGSGSGGSSNHLLVDREVVRESLKTSVLEALNSSGVSSGEILGVAAGLAGVDYDGSGAEEMRPIFANLGFERTVIEGDMVIAHAGALAGLPGIIALAGTGSSVLGIRGDGTRIKVGGWGPIFGDEGSAYRIGQAALRASARHFDGRGPETRLTAAVLEVLALSEFSEAVEAVYVDEMQPRDIAALSETVHSVAKQGDPVAEQILGTAGKELAECVTAAVHRLKIADRKIRVSYQGSVMVACEPVRISFCAHLSREASQVEIIPPRFLPVIGAYLLVRSSAGAIIDEALLTVLDEANNKGWT